jgi:hypothetical protein
VEPSWLPYILQIWYVEFGVPPTIERGFREIGVGDFVTQVHSQRISLRGCIIVEMDTTVVGSWIQLGLGLLCK